MRIRVTVPSAATTTDADRCCEVSPRNTAWTGTAYTAANVSAQRDLGHERGPAAGRAVDGQPAAQRLDAVGQPAQPAAARRVRAAHAVVDHGHPRVPVGALHLHAHERRL